MSLISAGKGRQMAREIAEIPAVVARQIAEGLPLYRAEGERLRVLEPRFFVTCARGTSDHAAPYFKYLAEALLGIPVASVGPSVASIYGALLKVEAAACIAISQSGASPDLVALQERAGADGRTAECDGFGRRTGREDDPPERIATGRMRLQAIMPIDYRPVWEIALSPVVSRAAVASYRAPSRLARG
jgi:hypothetical protein